MYNKYKNYNKIMIVMIGVFIPIFVNFLMSLSYSWVKGDIGDWISFYGSYFGALIGGIVAFGVARIQINAQKASEKNALIIQQLPSAVMIRIELNKIISFLEELYKIVDGDKDIDSIALLNFGKVQQINKQYWDGIDKIINSDLIAEIIEFKEKYLKLQETLELNLSEFDLEVNELKNKATKNQMEFNSLQHKVDFLNAKKEAEVYNKKYEWKLIKSRTIIDSAKKLKENIDNLIENINEIQKDSKGSKNQIRKLNK